jgi:hypothetical protein
MVILCRKNDALDVTRWTRKNYSKYPDKSINGMPGKNTELNYFLYQ